MHPALIQAAIGLKQKANSISPESKKRITGIVLLVIVFVLVRKKATDLFQKLFPKDLNKIDVNTDNITQDNSAFFSMSSTLESAMNGYGTQEDSIMDVMMRLRTQDDWYQLQKAFGVRKKDGGTFYPDLTGNLKMWLADELDASDLDKLRKILRQQGILY